MRYGFRKDGRAACRRLQAIYATTRSTNRTTLDVEAAEFEEGPRIANRQWRWNLQRDGKKPWNANAMAIVLVPINCSRGTSIMDPYLSLAQSSPLKPAFRHFVASLALGM